MSGFLTQSPNVLLVVAAMLATLTTGTLVRVQSLRGTASEVAKARLASLRSWWLVAGVIIVAALLGLGVSVLLFVMVSALAMREFLRLFDSGLSTRVTLLIFSLIPLNYVLIWLRWQEAFALFIPMASIMVVSLGLICEQRTEGFLRSAAGSAWGLLVTSYLLAHAVLLFTLPATANTVAGGAGWFLLLVVLTETNDIMQALVGRRLGRRKLAPIVSPHKTWEGFFGGVVSTVLLAMLLAPWLTPLSLWQAALGGLLISAGGLLGDLNISALKRDAGVKDSGTLLPGQGGILDRIDSLTFTAPLFYYFVRNPGPMTVAMTPADQQSRADGPTDRWLTIPNALCLIRLLGAFVLPVLAIANRPVAFVITYFVLTSTDWIDGKLARWLHQESKIGPKLDTVADVTMYGGLLFGLVWLFGSTLVGEAVLLGTGVVTYAGSCLASLIKFRRLPSYHTRAAKISWFLVLIAVVALFLNWSIWPLRIATIAVVLTNLEAIMISIVLKKRREDVPSLWHASRRSTSR